MHIENRAAIIWLLGMSITQIGILLQIIGTSVVVLVAGVFLAPEVIGPRVPIYITRILVEFASKLQNLVPEQFASRIERFTKGMLGLVVWLLIGLSTLFMVLATRMSNALFLVIGVITGVSTVFLLGWIISLPAFSLKAAKQSGTWDKGKFTPTEPTHPVDIGLSYRLKLALLLLTAILSSGLFWVVALLPLILSIIWRSVTQYLATEKAPRIIALFIGFIMLIAGLVLQFISSL